MQTVDPQDLAELQSFLGCQTPQAWVDHALKHQEILLINHAYLEKCAARTALNLMFTYPDKPDLQHKMSRLAREELVHYEQVQKLMKRRGIKYRGLKPSRYAGRLNVKIGQDGADRLIDTLIVGAFIEARSCERFHKISPHLDVEMSRFYTSLLKSEARHYQDYLMLAEQYSTKDITPRIEEFREIETASIESSDPLFRFHSGIPVVK